MVSTKDYAQFLEPDDQEEWIVDASVDADWASDKIGWKSTSAGHIFPNGALVMPFSRTQTTEVCSSAEFEVYAMGLGAVEALWVKTYLDELGCFKAVFVKMNSDSTAAISPEPLRARAYEAYSAQACVRSGSRSRRKADRGERFTRRGTRVTWAQRILRRRCSKHIAQQLG